VLAAALAAAALAATTLAAAALAAALAAGNEHLTGSWNPPGCDHSRESRRYARAL
jgi:hypothetical protein